MYIPDIPERGRRVSREAILHKAPIARQTITMQVAIELARNRTRRVWTRDRSDVIPDFHPSSLRDH